MNDGSLAFLDEKAVPETPEVVAEPAPVEPVAPAEPQADTGAQPTSPPEVAPQEAPHTVPISAILDEREKRQIAQRENEDLRRKVAEYEAAKAHPAPDPAENPREFAAYQQQQVQQVMWNERLNMSEAIARQTHGEDAVNAAREAFAQAVKSNPPLYAELQRQPNPYSFVVQWHQRQKLLDEIGSDPAAYRARIADQIRAEMAAQSTTPSVPTTPAKPNLPPSMASAPAAGTADTKTNGSLFDQTFGN